MPSDVFPGAAMGGDFRTASFLALVDLGPDFGLFERRSI